MNDDAVNDQAPTVPAIPLRARQRHRARSKKDQSSRWLARQALPSVIVEEVPLASATFPVVSPSAETPPPVATWEADVETFFNAADSMSPVAHEVAEDDALPVHAPRRGLAAIVIGAVALAGALCAAAMVKPPAPAPAAAAPPPVMAVVREPVVEAAPPAAVAIPEPAPAPAVPAKDLREKARLLLEHRNIPDAIATADEATKAEPESAEGWLLLGAAQLEAGRGADAKESFRTCTHVAKLGPVGECRSFSR